MREWLKSRRTELGFTMKELGTKLGISESYYCAIENGGRKEQLNVSMVAVLSETLDIPIERIVEYEMERIATGSAAVAVS